MRPRVAFTSIAALSALLPTIIVAQTSRVSSTLMTSTPVTTARTPIASTTPTQATNPPYLREMPMAQRVKAEIKGDNAMETAARQMGAFWQLQEVIKTLAGPRFYRSPTRDENRLLGEYRQGYYDAAKPYENIQNSPSHPDKPKWYQMHSFYETDDGFLDELFIRFMSANLRAQYFKARGEMIARTQARSGTAPTQPPPTTGAVQAESQTTPAGNAVLSVVGGFATQPGTANQLAGKAMLLMKESFGDFLKRTGMFQGPPGSPNTAPPLAAWAYSCRTGMPVCQQALYEARGTFVANTKLDINGRGTFQGVPPGTYYLFGQAIVNSEHFVWDFRVDLKIGANSVTLDRRNITPLDAESARATPPAGASESGAGSQPCRVTEPTRTAKPGVPANSALSVIGSGYVYTYSQTDRRTGQVVDSFTERGNFSDTTLYLLDEDAESILQRAGVEPGLLGSRLAMLSFLDAGTQVENVPGVDVMSSILGRPGTFAEVSKEAKAELDCVMKAIYAHSVAQVTTDANARGIFPNVPAGTYYLFGRFYRVKKPVRAGGMYWNLRVEVKPGRNLARLSVDNAALK